MNGLNPTTRCYPRTLDEAFPQHAYNWIEEPLEPIHWADVCIITIALCLWVGLIYWWSVQ
jgi:hypothetical protein